MTRATLIRAAQLLERIAKDEFDSNTLLIDGKPTWEPTPYGRASKRRYNEFMRVAGELLQEVRLIDRRPPVKWPA